MTSTDKLLAKVRAGRNNVRIDELLALMKAYGFTQRETSHGYLLQNAALRRTTHVAKPHGREKKVLKGYVDDCLDLIEQLTEDINEGS